MASIVNKINTNSPAPLVHHTKLTIGGIYEVLELEKKKVTKFQNAEYILATCFDKVKNQKIKIFLPKNISDGITQEEMDDINTGINKINLIYQGPAGRSAMFKCEQI